MRVTALPQSTPTPTVDPGVSFDPNALPSPAAPGTETAAPDLTWDDSPESVLIDGTFCCGFTSAEFVANALPEFRIWGDGHFLWVSHQEDGSRRVWETRLTPVEIQAILDRFLQAGFFAWDERYANDTVADFADQCITIQLKEARKQVCEYFEGAPPAFHELFDELASGLGRTGQDFIPQRGFLRTAVFDVDFVSPTIQWTDPALSLAKTGTSGAWIEGGTLQALWAALNQRPFGPIAAENGVYYMYTIQVPGLSLFLESE